MLTKGEPWYIHTILYAIILVLAYVLIRVSIIEPQQIVEQEKYYKQESRLRMANIREAEKLWQAKYGRFTDNLDSLITFLKTDASVEKAKVGIDSITKKSTNPFSNLTVGSFVPDSLYTSPKTHSRYIVEVDSSQRADTTIDRRGKILRVDTIKSIGNRYYIECPDGYGSIGDLNNDALKNTASWE